MIKRFIVLLFVNLILVLLQLSFLGELFGGELLPNLVLAFAFALAFSDLHETGKTSAFVGGLLLDLLGFNIVGFSSIIIVGCMIIYDFVRKNVSRSIVVNAISVFLSVAIYDKILGLSPGFFSSESIVGGVVTLLFTGIFYFLVSGYEK